MQLEQLNISSIIYLSPYAGGLGLTLSLSLENKNLLIRPSFSEDPHFCMFWYLGLFLMIYVVIDMRAIHLLTRETYYTDASLIIITHDFDHPI